MPMNLGYSDDEDTESTMKLNDDEEEEDEDSGLGGSNLSEPQELKGWDKARNLPPDAESQAAEDDALYVLILKVLKILAYIITFIIILIGSALAKITLVLMTSQLQPRRLIAFCAGKSDHLEVATPEIERIGWSWAITFAFIVPEAMVFIRAARICIFKETRWPSFLEFFVPLFFETCHVIGLSMLVFIVLPSLDSVSALMLTNGVCLIPALFEIATRHRVIEKPVNTSTITATTAQTNDPTKKKNDWFYLLLTFDLMAVVFIIAGLVLWPLYKKEPSGKAWLLPLACLLTSFAWWENYIDFVKKRPQVQHDDREGESGERKPFNPFQWLQETNFNNSSRYVTYLFISVYKVGLFLCGLIFSWWLRDLGDFHQLFIKSKLEQAFASHPINVTEIRPPVIDNSLPGGSAQIYDQYLTIYSRHNAPVFVMVAQILAAWITYMLAKFACKVGIQKFSFSFPLTLSVPLSLVIVSSLCGFRTDDVCFWKSVFPPYLYWNCPSGSAVDFLGKYYGWVWVLWILAQVWVTRHIWTPKFTRLERAEVLFVSPMYNGLLIDQSLALNRRRENRVLNNRNYDNDGEDDDDEEGEEENLNEVSSSAGGSNQYHQVGFSDQLDEFDIDTIPRIYACATMWHEEKEEMMEMLKSIFRMDEDQCARRVAFRYFGVVDQDYYEFETHIFFDDAFVVDKSKPGWADRPLRYLLNSYVKLFLSTIGLAANHVHETELQLNPPMKVPTPYGGRIEWILPGRTKLYLHLKNKDKIRHKKRWSQVMYMYYLLGYKLLDQDIPIERKETIAENTYLLALDGDIDFNPKAVQLLVDLMKKNKNLGAACGRIHPTGTTSLMVWYQKFEYAIGHWFQKATEHVIGCVLCSPGCFSLFRGKALLEDNVMARYTTESEEPLHFVQYDQGEDRWLCTLLLQRGFRVEYSAASDAKTHCPEAFGEFFNQRRRWVPSTMANIIDLLGDYKRTIRMNPDISYPYILYQMMMMGGSILGPGSIFLMLIGAFNAAFRIDNYTAFLWNFIPIFLFILVCFFFNKDIQLIVAQILAAAYCLVMVAVVVALMIQIQEDGPLAPSSLFFFGVACSFVIAALLHPLEIGCLPHGLVYYITIPSMYLILIIYSLMNLHDVSWGTREVPVETPAAAPTQEKVAVEEKKKALSIFGFELPQAKNDTEGSFEFSCAGLFKLMCCTQPRTEEKIQLQRIADSLAHVSKRLDSLEGRGAGSISGDRRTSAGSIRAPVVDHVIHTPSGLPPTIEKDEEFENAANEVEIEEPVNDDVYPVWAEDKDLKHAHVDFLRGPEYTFWKDLIAKYLKPIDKNEKKEEDIKNQLKDLRNKMVFFFFMINAVFVLAIFLLQNNKDTIFFEWPLGAKYNMTYIPDTTEIQIFKDSLSLEPIGVVFVFVFAVVIFIQFIAMLIHRLGTFVHIMASTLIDWCSKGAWDPNLGDTNALQKEGLRVIRKMQKFKNLDENAGGKIDKRKASRTDIARRKTVMNLEKSREGGAGVPRRTFIDDVFEQTFQAARTSEERRTRILGRPSGVGTDNNRRVTFQMLERRRTIVEQRRQSIIDRNSIDNNNDNKRKSISGRRDSGIHGTGIDIQKRPSVAIAGSSGGNNINRNSILNNRRSTLAHPTPEIHVNGLPQQRRSISRPRKSHVGFSQN